MNTLGIILILVLEKRSRALRNTLPLNNRYDNTAFILVGLLLFSCRS